jgi:transposase
MSNTNGVASLLYAPLNTSVRLRRCSTHTWYWPGGKKAKGRKRFVGVDFLGLVWALSMVTAGVQDRDGGCWLPAAARRWLPREREVIADSGFSRRLQEFVRRVCRWRVTITATPPDGFRVHPRRWVVERTFGWPVRYRRLMVNYEYLPGPSEALIQVAMTHLMLRRLDPPPEF